VNVLLVLCDISDVCDPESLKPWWKPFSGSEEVRERSVEMEDDEECDAEGLRAKSEGVFRIWL